MALDSELIGKVISDLRVKRQLSRPAVARSAGVTSNYLGMVESGKRTLSVATLKRVAEVLEIPVEMIACLGSTIPSRQDPRFRFAGVLAATQKAMWAAIDADMDSTRIE